MFLVDLRISQSVFIIKKANFPFNLNEGVSDVQEDLTDCGLEHMKLWIHSQLTTGAEAQLCLEEAAPVTDLPLRK